MESTSQLLALDGKKALCETCSTALHTLTITEAWMSVHLKLHSSFPAFVQAARQGCFICNHIVRSLDSEPERKHRWELAHASPTAKLRTWIHISTGTGLDAGSLWGRTELWVGNSRELQDDEIRTIYTAAGWNNKLRFCRLEDSLVLGCKGRSKAPPPQHIR
jgi:hypothetical protein